MKKQTKFWHYTCNLPHLTGDYLTKIVTDEGYVFKVSWFNGSTFEDESVIAWAHIPECNITTPF